MYFLVNKSTHMVSNPFKILILENDRWDILCDDHFLKLEKEIMPCVARSSSRSRERSLKRSTSLAGTARCDTFLKS